MNRRTLKKIALVVIQSLGICAVMFFLFYQALLNTDKRIKAEKLLAIQNNEMRIVELKIKDFSNEIEDVLGDLHFLEKLYEVESVEKHYDELEKLWSSVIESKKKYDQIRFLDTRGNEKIRINYSDTGAIIVSKDKLQNKKNMSYFINTLKIGKNQHYISKLELNFENGNIEMLNKPIFHLSSKVFNNKGKLLGMVIVSYKAKAILDDFRKLNGSSRGYLELLNSKGYWIVSNSKEQEWAFMYKEKEKLNFAEIFPEEWSKMTGNSGTFFTSKGLYTYAIIKLQDLYHKDNGEIGHLIVGDGDFKVVSFVGAQDKYGYLFNETKVQELKRIVSNNRMVFVLILISSFFIELALFTIIKSFKKIKQASDFDSLTKLYNRRAGMEKIRKALPADNRRKNNISICFVDINGLKQVNDTLGHKYGDELIKTVAEVFKKVIRTSDFCIRLGGDEFLIVFIDSQDEEAEMVWKRIQFHFEKINREEDRSYIISASHGIVDCDTWLDKNIDDAIKVADEHMYEEKKEIKKDNFSVIKKSI